MQSKKKLKSTRFFKPYNGNAYNLKVTGCGVYIIKKDDAIIYIGYASKDVRNTLYRHFQTWNDQRTGYTKRLEPYARITYAGQNRERFLVKVIFCPTVEEAQQLEEFLIHKIKPKDNSLKLELYSRAQLLRIEDKLDNATFISVADDEPPF